MADLLRDSGVSNGTFYARFPSKDALVHELQDRVLARLEASIGRECAALHGREILLEQAVRRLTRALAGQFRDHAGLLASLMRNGERDAIMQRRAAQTHALIERLFVETLAPRMRSPGQSERVIVMAHTVLSAVLIERISADQSAAAKHVGNWDALIEEMQRLLLAYLGASLDFQAEAPPATPVSIGLAPATDAPADPTERQPSAFSQLKIDQILQAASALFGRIGFESTTMSMVATAAKVGKATVYAHFKSKAELFAAVIASAGHAQVGSLPSPSEHDVETVLQKFGREAFDLMLRPANIGFFRMIAAEAGRFPELGPIFYEAGPVRLQASLAAFLSEAMARGDLRKDSAHLAACQFLGLICGDLQLQALVGAGRATTQRERKEVLQSGIAAFLRAYRQEVL